MLRCVSHKSHIGDGCKKELYTKEASNVSLYSMVDARAIPGGAARRPGEGEEPSSLMLVDDCCCIDAAM